MEPGLLVFCSLVGLVGLGVLWFRVVRPILEDTGLLSYGSLYAEDRIEDRAIVGGIGETKRLAGPPASVNRFPAPVIGYVNSGSADDAPSAADGRTDDGTDGAPWAYSNLQLDRSKDAALMVLLSAGWKTTDIRAVIKGGNDTIGAEIEAASVKLRAHAQPSPEPLKVWAGTPREEVIPR